MAATTPHQLVPAPAVDAAVIAAFWELGIDERHGHPVFKGLIGSHDVGDLGRRIDCLCRATLMRQGLKKGRSQVLPPNIVLMLAFNEYTVRHAAVPGLFVHLWIGTEMYHPVYFLCRQWSPAERESYGQSTPTDQIRIAHACLPWHRVAPEMPAIGVTLLLPDVLDRTDADAVVQYRLAHRVARPRLAVLLWLRGKLLFATLSELERLSPRNEDDEVASGGPFHEYGYQRPEHVWTLPLQSDKCSRWISEHELRGETLEGAINERLQDEIWANEGGLAEDFRLILPKSM